MAYPFELVGSRWVPGPPLLADDGLALDEFGAGVTLSGDIAVVGAPEHDESGSAYVFRNGKAGWMQEDELRSDPGDPVFQFGGSVAASGEVIVVGGWQQLDVPDPAVGVLYFFRFDGLAWALDDVQFVDDGSDLVIRSATVDVDGDVAVGGSHGNDEEGRVNVFRDDGQDWPLEDTLVPPPGDNDNAFGTIGGVPLDLDGTVLVIGGIYEDMEAAFVYRFDGGDDWELEAIIESPAFFPIGFAEAVAVSGDRIAIGAPEDPEAASDAGVVHLYAYDGASWQPAGRRFAADAAVGDALGSSLTMQDDLIVAGAPNASGKTPDTGTAVVFDLLGADCNMNGRPDECDIADGTSEDANGNGIPDECECEGDVNGNGDVGFSDLLAILTSWGPCPPGDCPEDLDGNGDVGFGDVLIVLLNWGPCR